MSCNYFRKEAALRQREVSMSYIIPTSAMVGQFVICLLYVGAEESVALRLLIPTMAWGYNSSIYSYLLQLC